MLHNLEHQGIARDMYFQIAGKTEDELLEEGSEEAERTLKREAVLAAIVEAEDLEPSDSDVLDALQASAVRDDTTPEKLRERLEKAGRLDDLLDDLRQRAALDLIVEHATAVEPEPVRRGRGVRGRRRGRRVERPSTGRARALRPRSGTPSGGRFPLLVLPYPSGKQLAAGRNRARGPKQSEDHEPTCPDGR